MIIKKSLLVCVMSFIGMTAAIAGPTNVPFKGTVNFIGSMDPSAGTATCPILGLNYGGGSLTHMGKSAMVATDCVTPVGMTALGPILAASDGKLTLTSDNGDTVKGTYAGTFMPVSNGNNGVAYQFTNVMYSISGGTGRFANARGTGTLFGTQDAQTGKGTITVSGTISY